MPDETDHERPHVYQRFYDAFTRGDWEAIDHRMGGLEHWMCEEIYDDDHEQFIPVNSDAIYLLSCEYKIE